MRLIDAKAMEKQTKESFKENPFLMGQLLRWIRKQPTIDAEPVKHGRWIWNEDDFYTGLTLMTCSLCREEWCAEDVFDVESLNYRYCPGCGARMDEEGES